MKNFLIVSLCIIIIFSGCSKDSTSPNDSACLAENAGTWELTEMGELSNSDCTGIRIPSSQDSYDIFQILSDDGTFRSVGGISCSEGNADDDWCNGTWSCNSNSIRIFFTEYYFDDNGDNDDNMVITATYQVTQMYGTPDEYTECQYSTYTKVQ